MWVFPGPARSVEEYAQEHPFFFHLPKSSSYGLPEESIISMTALTAAHKSAIYGVRGALGNDDMQAINERGSAGC